MRFLSLTLALSAGTVTNFGQGAHAVHRLIPPEAYRIRDNVCLLRPETIDAISHLIVVEGHRIVPEAVETVRADSFVVETRIHYPTESTLIRDGGTVNRLRQVTSVTMSDRSACTSIARFSDSMTVASRLSIQSTACSNTVLALPSAPDTLRCRTGPPTCRPATLAWTSPQKSTLSFNPIANIKP